MSILDDAIREHLELKRAHGADETELKRLEDEAFGPPRRPDEPSPFGEEAPTEFLADAGAPSEAPSGRGVPNIADLQEAPPPPKEEAPPESPESVAAKAESPAAEAESPAAETEIEVAEPLVAPEPEAEAAEPASELPVEEAQPAAEHEAIPELSDEAPAAPEAPAEPSHDTEERHAIAEQPTQFFDVEAEIASDQPDEVEEVEEEEEEDDFFSEQRLSEELDQALEAPLPGEEPPRSRADEPIPPGPHTEEAEAHYAERDQEGEFEDDDEFEEEDDDVYEPEAVDHDDVLEDTPDFLEDAPDADDAWFEQRPPKDFDFDD